VCVCSVHRNACLFNHLNLPDIHNALHYTPISTTPHAFCTKDVVCDRKIMKSNLHKKKENFSVVLWLPLEWFFSNITSLLNLKFASLCITIHFKYINQPDATISPVYYLTFMYSSTCFGRPHAHHQELNNCSSSL
jgi:hypothetical protein